MDNQFSMNMLGKTRVGFVLRKEPKKRRKSAGNDAGRGIFAQNGANLRHDMAVGW